MKIASSFLPFFFFVDETKALISSGRKQRPQHTYSENAQGK